MQYNKNNRYMDDNDFNRNQFKNRIRRYTDRISEYYDRYCKNLNRSYDLGPSQLNNGRDPQNYSKNPQKSQNKAAKDYAKLREGLSSRSSKQTEYSAHTSEQQRQNQHQKRNKFYGKNEGQGEVNPMYKSGNFNRFKPRIGGREKGYGYEEEEKGLKDAPRNLKYSKNLQDNSNKYIKYDIQNNPKRPSTHLSNRSQSINDFRNPKYNEKYMQNKPKRSSSSYKLVCENCYNQKAANKIYTQIAEKEDPKDKLTRDFNNVTLFMFLDKLKKNEKDRKDIKTNALADRQKKALEKLTKYQLRNPPEKEKLQQMNENELAPFVQSGDQDPRYRQVMDRYDWKERMIAQNPDIYRVNKPRKAIDDYYKKTNFDAPISEPIYEVSEEAKKNFQKELKNQIKTNKRLKELENRRNREQERKLEDEMKKYEKEMKEREDENKKALDDLRKINKDLYDYKKAKENAQKAHEDELAKFHNDLIKKEQEKQSQLDNEKKEKNMQRLREWLRDAEKAKNKQKKEEEEENQKWINFAKTGGNKCKHGIEMGKCAICSRTYPKEKLIRMPFSRKNTGTSSHSSKSGSVY